MVKSPKNDVNDVNACEDFIEIVTAGHIVAAVLRLKSKDDTPTDDKLLKMCGLSQTRRA